MLHHRHEEIEHFAMLLELLRRRLPELDNILRSLLFRDDDIASLDTRSEAH